MRAHSIEHDASEPREIHLDEAMVLSRARRGDRAAIDSLYSAHVASARQVAALVADPTLADDLVADAFTRVIAQLAAGRGPTENFRAYLHATVRNRNRDVQRRAHRERPASHQPWVLEDGLGPVDGPDAHIERTVDDEYIVAAYDALPEDWREVLWHLELRDRPVPEVAAMMGLSPAAVSSLAYRAREGLRLAYLDQRLARLPHDSDCEWTRGRLSRYVRDKLSPRAASRLEAHLEDCSSCAAAIADLDHTNKKLAALLLPAIAAVGAHLPTDAAEPVLHTTILASATSTSAGHSAAVSALASWKTAVAAAVMVGLAATPSTPAAAAEPTRAEPLTQAAPQHISSAQGAQAAQVIATRPLTAAAPLVASRLPALSPPARETNPDNFFQAPDPAAGNRHHGGCLTPPPTAETAPTNQVTGPITDPLVALGTLITFNATTATATVAVALVCNLAAHIETAPDLIDQSALKQIADGANDAELDLVLGLDPKQNLGPSAPQPSPSVPGSPPSTDSPLVPAAPPGRGSPASPSELLETVGRTTKTVLDHLPQCLPGPVCAPPAPAALTGSRR